MVKTDKINAGFIGYFQNRLHFDWPKFATGYTALKLFNL